MQNCAHYCLSNLQGCMHGGHVPPLYCLFTPCACTRDKILDSVRLSAQTCQISGSRYHNELQVSQDCTTYRLGTYITSVPKCYKLHVPLVTPDDHTYMYSAMCCLNNNSGLKINCVDLEASTIIDTRYSCVHASTCIVVCMSRKHMACMHYALNRHCR